MKTYVSYIRVSTKSQGDSGLGLEAQRSIINHYYPSIEKEFREVKSGKNLVDRKILLQAIDYCNTNDCYLVVAKTDRLSRDVKDTLTIWEKLNKRLICCDLPISNGQLDKFTLTLFSAFAERERELISIRIKNAMDEKIKNEGEWRIGNKNLKNLQKQGVKVIKEKADKNKNNIRAYQTIEAKVKNGLSFNQIAKDLSGAGIESSSGSTNWQAVQVQRIYERYR